MNPKKLSYKAFLKTFELVPRVAISLFITDEKSKVLLTKRAISPLKNYWHLPGSFILKNEPIKDCILRIAKNELGIKIEDEQFEIALATEDIEKDPRGHVIDLIYKIKLATPLVLKSTVESKEIRFFQKLPAKIGFNHRVVLTKLGYK